MKFVKGTLLLFCTLAASSVWAQATPPNADFAQGSPTENRVAETPAMKRVMDAKKQVQKNPQNSQAANELAAALIVRARESANPAYYRDAEDALAQGFRVNADNFQLRKTQVALLLAEQKYVQGKEQATLLNRRVPDDAAVYGYLAEAQIALGDYDAADQSAQWMLNMLPNNVPGLLIGADLRFVYGDAEGALEFLNQAQAEIPPTEFEELAWIANKIAAIRIETGKTAAAEQTLRHAQELFPGYRETLVNLAQVRLAEHRAGEAAALLMQAAQIRSDACVQYELSMAQRQAGAGTASNGMVEGPAAVPGSVGSDSDSERCAVLMKADDRASAAEALQMAERLIAVRHDVWTLDAYAWALYANGQYAKADATIRRATDVGIQNAQIFDHAGHIAQKLNHDAEAAKDFELSLRANPDSPYAEDARAEGQRAGVSADVSESGSTPLVAEKVPVENSLPAAGDVAAADAESGRGKEAAFPALPAELLIPRATETDRMIHAAQEHVRVDPKDAEALARLGAAYFQRARETADVGDFELAEQSLKASLQLDSDGFGAAAPMGTLAEVYMGEHRFAEALAMAQKALALGSGDVSPFAIVGDAYADMGEYSEAAQSYARLTPPGVTLSPRAAYARDSRISYLKFVAGDTAEAIRLMKAAVAEGTESQIPGENLAWLNYELGEYYTQAGNTGAADAAYRAALSIHPGDYRALASLARLRANGGRYDEAILLYQKAIAVVPMPVFAAELGDLYAKTGRWEEAEKEYRLVEYIGRLGQINQVLHNRDLALFYADHDRKLPEALALARKEFEVRHDVYTWDALAWALFRNGHYDEASQASEHALHFGTRDALLLYHSGMIAEKAGKSEQAGRCLAAALEINPHFHLIYADDARRSLASLTLAQLSKASVDGHER